MTEPAGYCIEDLNEGMDASFSKTLTDADIVLFSGVSGDTNPVHLDAVYAAGTRFGGRIVHGMLTASLISAVLGTKLPGPGAIYLSQNLRFRAAVKPGDTVTARVRVATLDRARNRVTLACTCHVGETLAIDGDAQVMVPSREQKGAAS